MANKSTFSIRSRFDFSVNALPPLYFGCRGKKETARIHHFMTGMFFIYCVAQLFIRQYPFIFNWHHRKLKHTKSSHFYDALALEPKCGCCAQKWDSLTLAAWMKIENERLTAKRFIDNLKYFSFLNAFEWWNGALHASFILIWNSNRFFPACDSLSHGVRAEFNIKEVSSLRKRHSNYFTHLSCYFGCFNTKCRS